MLFHTTSFNYYNNEFKVLLFILRTVEDYLLEIVSDLELALLRGDVGLDLSVGVVDDGQEHVEQHKEHEEHIGDEEDWTKYAVGVLQGVEIEITQDDTEQGEAEKTEIH